MSIKKFYQFRFLNGEIRITFYGDYHPFSVPEPELLRWILKENGELAEEWWSRLKSRMGQLVVFMKELKQRFVIWYNKRNNNQGTLWAERYQSTLVEDHWHTLSAVSAYIDLNPVRAKIVKNPAEYQYCGYAALLAGDRVNSTCLLGIYRSREDEIGQEKTASHGELLAWYQVLELMRHFVQKAPSLILKKIRDITLIRIRR